MLHYLNKPLETARPSRRTFLKLSGGVAGGLVLALAIPRMPAAEASEGEYATPFVKISPDGLVTVINKHQDMGQGNATGLVTLVADELDASPDQMRVEFAPANAEIYKNFLFGIQGTGGSTAIPNAFEQYRTAGATAKAMLVAAAAKKWGVDPASVAVSAGTVASGENSASFGELAGLAAEQTVPETVTLKTPDQWVYISKDFSRVDVPKKTTGAVGVYGMDVQMDNMLVAVTARPPRFGATLASVDDTEAKAVPGVEAVLTIPQGVVVLADKTHTAIKARDLLAIEWDFSAAENRSTDQLVDEFRAALDKEGLPAASKGDVEAGLAKATKVVEADYVFPLLAHAPMEPLDVTVLFEGDKATFWTASQIQTLDQNYAAGVLGLDPSNIHINTLWGGGSFGRRAIYDAHYVAEAATIAKVYGEARPIKMVYTREDDIRGGYYRPLHLHRVRAGVDSEGNITGWHHRVVGQSIMIGTPFESLLVKDGVDHASTEGAADNSYAIENYAMDVQHPKIGVPALWWRSVGHTHTAYVMETMIDELAEAAGMDPVAFRLKNETDPRKAEVLRLAAEKAGWDTAATDGRHRGVAVHKSFNSYVAEIAEVTMRDDDTVKVEKVICGVDCGVPINPDNITAQVEGGLGYGLSAILREEITMTDGEVDQSNFTDYLPLRITDMPEVEVHIVQSSEAPTGIGEPGTPPIGPAVANAVAKATGQRIRDLPFSKHGLA